MVNKDEDKEKKEESQVMYLRIAGEHSVQQDRFLANREEEGAGVGAESSADDIALDSLLGEGTS